MTETESRTCNHCGNEIEPSADTWTITNWPNGHNQAGDVRFWFHNGCFQEKVGIE